MVSQPVPEQLAPLEVELELTWLCRTDFLSTYFLRGINSGIPTESRAFIRGCHSGHKFAAQRSPQA